MWRAGSSWHVQHRERLFLLWKKKNQVVSMSGERRKESWRRNPQKWPDTPSSLQISTEKGVLEIWNILNNVAYLPSTLPPRKKTWRKQEWRGEKDKERRRKKKGREGQKVAGLEIHSNICQERMCVHKITVLTMVGKVFLQNKDPRGTPEGEENVRLVIKTQCVSFSAFQLHLKLQGSDWLS